MQPLRRLKALRVFALLMTVCAACEDGHGPMSRAGDEDGSMSPVTPPSSAQQGPDEQLPDAAALASADSGAEATTIELNVVLFVGAFKVMLHEVAFIPDRTLVTPGKVVVRFSAENLTASVFVPFSGMDREDIQLEMEGRFLFGEISAPEIPGLREGDGTMEWSIRGVPEAARKLPGSVVTIGGAEANQQVVPFNHPAQSVTLPDVTMDSQFTVAGYRSTTVALRRAYVTYNDRSFNRPLPRGTAHMILNVTMSADPDMWSGGEYWGTENTGLKRPDGVTVAAELNEAVYPGFRKELSLIYELVVPVSGTYMFEVSERSVTPVTRSLVVP